MLSRRVLIGALSASLALGSASAVTAQDKIYIPYLYFDVCPFQLLTHD